METNTYQRQYIIDAENFEGVPDSYTLPNGKIAFSKGLTFDEYKKKENNPNLILISEKELDERVENYKTQLSSQYKEITQELYDSYWGELRLKTLHKYKAFIVNDEYQFGLYPFCFSFNGKFYHSVKDPNLSDKELIQNIKNFLKTLI